SRDVERSQDIDRKTGAPVPSVVARGGIEPPAERTRRVLFLDRIDHPELAGLQPYHRAARHRRSFEGLPLLQVPERLAPGLSAVVADAPRRSVKGKQEVPIIELGKAGARRPRLVPLEPSLARAGHPRDTPERYCAPHEFPPCC